MNELTNNFWHWFVVGFSAGCGWWAFGEAKYFLARLFYVFGGKGFQERVNKKLKEME